MAPGLSPRETRVLALVAAGHSNSEIAARLQLSVGSVASYRHRAMRKLGIGSIHEIVSWAFHNGNVLAEGEEWDAERFLATVRRAPLMVLVADADMRLLDASEAALRELGYSYEELLRLSVPDIVLDREDAEQRYASYRFTGVQHGTIVLRRRDSSAFGASYTATIRHIGDTQHYVSVLVPE